MSAHRFTKDWLSAPFKVSDPGASGTYDLNNKGRALCPVTTAAAEARTIPSPDVAGQEVLVYMDTDGGDATVTVTGGQGISTFVLDDAGDFVILNSIAVGGTAKWALAATYGVGTSGLFNDITGTDSSLGIAGQAAAQGGAVAIVGGASSTSANAGGAVTLAGGAPGATGVGGAVTITGAIGGATSGAGGAVSLTGGAGTNGNAAGGAASVVGGAGQGSATGGAISITTGAGGSTGASGALTITTGAVTATSGAASGAISITTPAGATASGASTGGASGAITVQTNAGGTTATGTGGAGGLISILAGAGGLTTGAGTAGGAGGGLTFTAGAGGAGTTPTTGGAGGAVAITAGAGGNGTTSGAGGNVTITAGAAGTGGNVAGGTINLVPGAAVGTGLGGEVQVNSVAGTFEATYTAPLMTTAVPASGTAQPIYIATRAMRLKKAYASVVTFNSSPTIQLTKDSSTTAPGAGTAMLAAVITLAANNAPVTQSASATVATATLAAGDRISFLTGGTIGTSAGLTITMLLTPV